MILALPAYDVNTGTNTGNLGFQTLRGQNRFNNFPNLSGQIANPGGPGYIDIFGNFDPNWRAPGRWIDPKTGTEVGAPPNGLPNEFAIPDPFDSRNRNPGYTYDPMRRTPDQISYGSQQLGQSPSTAIQTINGQQYNVGSNNFQVGQSSAPQKNFKTSVPAASPTQSPIPVPTSFMFGDNGSLGTMNGTFGNNNPGQSAPFYQSQPSALTSTNPALGTFSPWNPGQKLQALQNTRSPQ